MIKKALITGITGQDGPYLAKLLIEKGYEVYGIVRSTSHTYLDFRDDPEFKDMAARIKLVSGDLTDGGSINHIISSIKPDEIYNLAGQSNVGISFKQPELTADVTALGLLRILEAVKEYSPKTKVCQASSSEMFGDVADGSVGQNELSRFNPISPYATAKLFAHNLISVYRRSYGIFACSAICFNHESPRRDERFVTRKISKAFSRDDTKLIETPLELGYIDALRDWGAAPDYVEGMYLMLQQDKADDFVLSTGTTHSVREFVELAFYQSYRDKLKWEGEGVNEVGKCYGNIVIKINPEFYRPAEVPILFGDSSKAQKILGWKPKMDFPQLVKWMVDSDVYTKN